MIWACIAKNGIGTIKTIDGHINSQAYVSILEECLWPVIANFRNESIPVLDWPPQSPDLNPIENVWLYLKRRLAPITPTLKNRADLKKAVEEIWYNIPSDFIEDLYNFMPKRVLEVIRMKGEITKF